ncbi:hypothetical protein D3C73_680170 [compost metagenome]
MRGALQVGPGLIDGRHIGKHRDVVADVCVVIVDRVDGQPLRIQFTVLPAIPQFPAPQSGDLQGFDHVAVKRVVLFIADEDVGLEADGFLGTEAGDMGKRRVHRQDVAAGVGDDHAVSGIVQNDTRQA